METEVRESPGPVRADVLWTTLLLAVALCYHWGFLFGGKALYGDDALLFGLPQAKFLSECLHHHTLPFWCPSLFTGYPLYAEGQLGIFHPLTLLIHSMFPFDRAAALSLFLYHVLLIQLCYVLARLLGIRPVASVIFSTCFSFGGFVTGHLIHANVLRSLFCWPLLWILEVLSSRGRLNATAHLAASGLTLGLLFLAGHHQTALIVVLAWALWVRIQSPGTWVFRLAGPLLLGGALAAIQLWPSVELFGLSVRNRAANWSERATWSASPASLTSWLLPYLFGSERRDAPYFGTGNFHELRTYMGIVPVILLWALGLFGSDRLSRFLGQLAIFAILLAFGSYSPLYVLHLVPPLSLFRNPCRLMVLAEWCLTLRAAIAFEELLSGKNSESLARWSRRHPPGRLLFFTLFFCALCLAGTRITGTPGITPSVAALRDDPAARLTLTLQNGATGAALTGGLVVVTSLLLSAIARGWWPSAALLALLTLSDLLGFSLRVWDRVGLRGLFADEPAAISYISEPPNRHRLFAVPFSSQRPLEDYVAFRFHCANLFGGTPFGGRRWEGIPSVAGYSPLTPSSWTAFFGRPGLAGDMDIHLATLAALDPTRDRWKLNLAHVDMLIADKDIPRMDTLTSMSDRGMRLYRNRRALPRAFVVRELHRLEAHSDEMRELEKMNALVPTVVIGEPGQQVVAAAVSVVGEGVQLEEPQSDALQLFVTLKAPGYVVISDLYYPGWNAWIDGRPIAVQPCCQIFRAIKVPGGVHDIRLTFDPPVFRRGAGVTLVALVLTIGLVVLSWRRTAAGSNQA
jgi:hypothetical protein